MWPHSDTKLSMCMCVVDLLIDFTPVKSLPCNKCLANDVATHPAVTAGLVDIDLASVFMPTPSGSQNDGKKRRLKRDCTKGCWLTELMLRECLRSEQMMRLKKRKMIERKKERKTKKQKSLEEKDAKRKVIGMKKKGKEQEKLKIESERKREKENKQK